MKSIFLAIALLLFILGTYIGNRDFISKSQSGGVRNRNIIKEVLSESEEGRETGYVNNELNKIPADDFLKTVTPTLRPFPILVTVVPLKSSPLKISEGFMSGLVYPGALTVEETPLKLSLISLDDIKSILEWYKARLNEMEPSGKISVYYQGENKYMIELSDESGAQNTVIEIEKEEDGNVKINITKIIDE